MTQLKDYILEVDHVLSNDQCDMILSEYSSSDEWLKSGIGSVKDDGIAIVDTVRNCDTIYLSSTETVSRNQETRTQIDNLLFEAVGKAVKEYMSRIKYVSISSDSGYELLRYNTGEFYKNHVDSYTHEFRTLTCSIALNDEYTGGEFSFFQEHNIKQKRGSAIVFPSNFMFPHQVLEVTSGTRYSIVTWLK